MRTRGDRVKTGATHSNDATNDAASASRYPGTLCEEPPLRIALVVERFVPGIGGVENVAWQVAHELARQGEAVTVVAREFDASAGAAGLALRPVDSPGRRHPLRTLAFSHAAARLAPRAAAPAARGAGFDLVHSFARTRHQDLFRAGGGSHADYLERNHAPLGRAYRRMLPRHASLLALERQVFADASQRIQCASRLVADRLRQEYGVPETRLWLLPNAVDASRYARAPHREAGARLRQALAPQAARIWLFPGSGWHRKGLDRCLSALARANDPQALLFVAGRDARGPWQRRAEALGVADRVRFLGARDDLPTVYAAVDGVVLPTRYDAFANVTFEAAAAGLPVVTTAANGAAEWLSSNACIRLEDARDEVLVEALAAAMNQLRDPSLRRQMGEAARREVEHFDWPGHVARLRAEYQRIVGARERGPERARSILQTNPRRTLERIAPDAAAAADSTSHSPTHSPTHSSSDPRTPAQRSFVLKTHHLRTGRHPIRERVKRALGRSPARREWRALRALHAAGVAVPEPLDTGRSKDGDEWLALEDLAGESFSSRFAVSDAAQRERLVDGLAATLEALYAAGYVHGDLHPGNLHVSSPPERVYLLDLQHARRARSEWARRRASRAELARLELSLARAAWPAELRAQLRHRLRVPVDLERALPRAAADRVRGRMRRLRRRLVREALPSPEQAIVDPMRRPAQALSMHPARSPSPTPRIESVRRPLPLARRFGLRDPGFSQSTLQRALALAGSSATRRLRRAGRSSVAEVEVEGRALVVKWSAGGSLPERLLTCVRGTRARRGFERGLRARILLPCVARPLAYLETREFGLPGENWLVLERVGDEDLDHLKPAHAAAAEALARTLGQGLADLHAVGLDHRDLKGSNLRIESHCSAPRFWLVDLEDLRGPARLRDARRIEALAALQASLADEDFDLAFRESLFAHYVARLPFAGGEPGGRRAWQKILRRAQARGHRFRGDGISPS